MSRPKAKQYTLKEWSITYKTSYYESSRKTGTQHYQAQLIWCATYGNLHEDVIKDHKNFVEYEDALKWIEENKL